MIVAGVLGGALGATGTVYVANVQVAAEDERSRDEFLRTQQQNAYADFIFDSNATSEAADRHYEQIEKNAKLLRSESEEESTAASAAIEGSEQNLVATLQEFSNSWNVVQLVGSPAVTETGGQLVLLQEALARDLTDSIILSYPDMDVFYGEARGRIHRAELERNRLIAEFLDSARKDFGL